jgi:hypothetical protein
MAGCAACNIKQHTSTQIATHHSQPLGGSSSTSGFSKATTGRKCASRVWLLSLMFRSVYVAFTTLVAVALPFFAVILGLVAALTFYQTAVLYPVLMHRTVFPRRPPVVLAMNGVLVLMAAVIAMVVVGSVAVIVMNASSLSPLKAL